MRAAHHCIVVTPTGDAGEYEHGRIIVKLTPDNEQTTIYRGVVVDVGPHMEQEGLEPGCVVFYTGYYRVLDYHVVPTSAYLCFQPTEES